jgi:hypothetical protein
MFSCCCDVDMQLERFFKLNLYGHDPDGLSAIEPLQYRDRYVTSMCLIAGHVSLRPSFEHGSLMGKDSCPRDISHMQSCR